MIAAKGKNRRESRSTVESGESESTSGFPISSEIWIRLRRMSSLKQIQILGLIIFPPSSGFIPALKFRAVLQ
jgi:hypothetical protein